MTRSYAPDYMDDKPASLIKGYMLQEDGSLKEAAYDMLQVGYADGNIQSNVDDLLRWHKHLYMSQEEVFLSRERMKQCFLKHEASGQYRNRIWSWILPEWFAIPRRSCGRETGNLAYGRYHGLHFTCIALRGG